MENLEALEGLDTLANLAILGEGDAPGHATTTKHPRHRPGCSCIVCIQPPSGKGPKHKQSCTCNVCLTVKRRFRTLMLRREKKQSEKDAETTRKKPSAPIPAPAPPPPAKSPDDSAGNSPEEPVKTKPPSTTSSPFKGQIDLNIQPEREEELSPGSDHVSTMKLLQDATERYLKQQRLLSDSVCSEALFGNQSQKVDGGDAGKPVDLGTSDHRDTDAETTPPPLAMKPPSVSPAAIG